MSIPVEAGKRWEVRDENGAVVGYVLSAEQLQALQAERDSLRDKVRRLQAQVSGLEEACVGLRAEKDNFEKILHYWEKKGIAPLTRQEMENLREHGIPFEQIVSELEGLLPPSTVGDGR